MFTEQPAPPHPAAEVQIVELAVPKAASSVVVPSKIAAPEMMPIPAPTPAPSTGRATSEAAPTENKPTAPSAASDSKPAGETAKAQRRQEVEQALIEITAKAHAKQQEQQQQQAAAEAAKYTESGDFEAAEKATTDPALSAKLRAALLKKLQAKKAKDAIAAKRGKPSKVAKAKPNGKVSMPELLSPAGRDYTVTPIVPFNQAEMRVRLGKLIGRNLDFAFPLTVPASITSIFGWRMHPISGAPRFHRGIDLGAPLGSPIVAVKSGKIETAGLADGYGLTVVLRHTLSQETLYAHLSQVFVKPGQTVKKGQLLGLVGSTGNSTGPHLHFELREQTSEGWVALDPAMALSSAIALSQSSNQGAISRRKPQSFNLALSGLLDVTPPRQLLRSPFVNSALTKLLTPPSELQPQVASDIWLPFAFLQPARFDLSWLSPWVDGLVANDFNQLPVTPQTVSFNSVPALSDLPEPVAFNPAAASPQPATVRLATEKLLAGLTIAEQMRNATRLRAVTNLPTQTPQISAKLSLPQIPVNQLKLSDRRLAPSNHQSMLSQP